MELIELRYSLAIDRIREIPGENAAAPAFLQYFEKGAEWFMLIDEVYCFLTSKEAETASVADLRKQNRKLYEDILPENYAFSYSNPEYAAAILGEEAGPVMAALWYEMRSAIPFVYRLQKERVLIRAELFLEVYTAFTIAMRENGQIPPVEQIKSIIRQFLCDYSEDEMTAYLRDKLIDGDSRIMRIVSEGSGDIRNLYLTGEYVTDDETESAVLINRLPQEKITLIADTVTEGFRRSFLIGGKNLASKKNSPVLFHAGFERIFIACAENLKKMGLNPYVPAEVHTLFHSYQHGLMGYNGADPNPQYTYDHREDLALFLDEQLRVKRLEGLSNAYKRLREKTVLYAGPVILETFGSKPFMPSESKNAPRYTDAQKQMHNEYEIRSYDMYSDAIVAKDRSFTIIDFPLPSIADSFPLYHEIFDAVLSINTLDNALFERVQTRMTDVLNTASHVEVKGRGGNRTDLKVNLVRPSDPDSEANFENCTADINIPVGEVFTTPVLKGTEGVLHVSGVYLEGLYFKDLEITFRDGRVRDYRCANFEDELVSRRYIEENVLFHHKDLPMGELAIGTNTTAYAAAVKYGIFDRFPILIAEKTGPHFAVGDTCYGRREDNRMYNPDGKEIIAKENEVSALRNTDPDKAYYGCHTDITIPYEELAEFTAVRDDGARIPILKDGRFVLEGTEILNGPLDALK